MTAGERASRTEVCFPTRDRDAGSVGVCPLITVRFGTVFGMISGLNFLSMDEYSYANERSEVPIVCARNLLYYVQNFY